MASDAGLVDMSTLWSQSSNIGGFSDNFGGLCLKIFKCHTKHFKIFYWECLLQENGAKRRLMDYQIILTSNACCKKCR